MSKSKFSIVQTINVGFSKILLYSLVAVIASPFSILPATSQSPDNHLLAQRTVCEGRPTLLEAVTRNYIVFICSTADDGSSPYKPFSYEGYAKKTSQGSIVLPLQSYKGWETSDRPQFVALNGDTRYTLTRSQLLVTRKRRTLIRERIVRWCTYPGINNSC